MKLACRGAGGVDQGGERLRAHVGPARLHDVGRDPRPGGDERREVVAAALALDADHALERRPRTGGLDLRGLLRRLGEEQARPRVGEDPGDLLLRRRLVDGHSHGAGVPDRVVEQRPLVTGAREDGDPVAGLDAGRDEAACGGAHLEQELRRADVGPPAVDAARHDHVVGVLCGVLDDVVGKASPLGHPVVRGRGVFEHGRRLLRARRVRSPATTPCRTVAPDPGRTAASS
jgi:hypothetical protein